MKVVSGNHSFIVTPKLFLMAISIAIGASAGRWNPTCYVVEQGGSRIPCMIIGWSGYDHAEYITDIAFPIGEMLELLDSQLPRLA